eukprot:5107278-Prymnesium_polylepis.1
MNERPPINGRSWAQKPLVRKDNRSRSHGPLEKSAQHAARTVARSSDDFSKSRGSWDVLQLARPARTSTHQKQTCKTRNTRANADVVQP